MKARRRGLFAIFAAIAFAYAAIFFLQHFYGASSGQDGARTDPRPGPCHGRRPPAAPGQPHHGNGASPGGDARRHKPLHLPLPARCREASRPEGGSALAQGARGVHRRRPLPDGRSEGPLRHPERRRLPQGREATACAGHPCLHAGLRDDRRHRLGWRRTRTSPSSARPPAPFPLRSAPSRGCALGQGSQAGARGAPLFSPPSLPSRLAGRQGKAPSARLSPAQVHYLVNDCELESPGLATLFLSLARKGRCRLSAMPRRATASSASSLRQARTRSP